MAVSLRCFRSARLCHGYHYHFTARDLARPLIDTWHQAGKPTIHENEEMGFSPGDVSVTEG